MSKHVGPSYEFTLHVRDNCLCLHAQRAARALARRFDDVLRPLGLTHGQFSLLTSLNRPEPPNIASVSSLLAMDRTTLTACLKPLERRGLVKVAVDREDKRSRRLTLAPAGRALLIAAAPLWKQAHAQIEGVLPPSSPGRLRAGLRALSGHAAPEAGRAATHSPASRDVRHSMSRSS